MPRPSASSHQRERHTTRHDLANTRRSTGEKVALHACVVIAVNDEGRITRLDEYFDSAEATRFAP